MIERRFHDRRSGDSGGGRRVSDRRVSPKALRSQAAFATFTRSLGVPLRFVVVGCRGVAGANMARFLKLWVGDGGDVTLIEPESTGQHATVGQGSSGGFAEYFPYDRRELASRYGIHIIGSPACRLNPDLRSVTLADGSTVPYDRIAFAPGAMY